MSSQHFLILPSLSLINQSFNPFCEIVMVISVFRYAVINAVKSTVATESEPPNNFSFSSASARHPNSYSVFRLAYRGVVSYSRYHRCPIHFLGGGLAGPYYLPFVFFFLNSPICSFHGQEEYKSIALAPWRGIYKRLEASLAQGVNPSHI